MNRDDFKRLQRAWYKTLKEEGFEDIETLLSNGTMADLMTGSASAQSCFRQAKETPEQIQSFYRLACWFLHDFNFASELDRRIWELFSEGKTMRAIGDDVKLSPRAVHRRIHRLIKGPLQDYRKMVLHDAN